MKYCNIFYSYISFWTNIFILFFFLLGNLFFSQAIDTTKIIVHYKTSFLIDTANTYTKKDEIVSLLIGNKSSLFKSDQKVISDSVAKIVIEKGFENPVNGRPVIRTSQIPYSKFKPEVFFADGQLTVYDKILNVMYSFNVNEKINWKIEDGIKVISKYTCRKAIGKYHNKEITAWYTEEIPINEGPYTFKGLPGLILEAYDNKEYFHFIMVGLKSIKKPIILDATAVKTEYEKFYKKRKEVMDDPVGAYMGIFGKPLSKDLEERVIKNIKNVNNFLD